MSLTPNASLSLAVFFGPPPPLYRPVDVTGWTPEELDDLADNDAWSEAADADDLARWEARRRGQFFQQARETLTDDPLRGDPDCPTVRHLVALLHRPRDHAAAFFAGADRGRAEATDRGPWGGVA